MSDLQFYLKDENENYQYAIDPVEEFSETETHWIIYNGWHVYEISKAEYNTCTPYIRLTPADDNPLYRMRDKLEEMRSTVLIDWN